MCLYVCVCVCACACVWLNVSITQNLITSQARRQGGGFEGVRSNPPFGLQKDFIHRLTVHFKCPIPFESGPLASMLLTITIVQTTLVAAMRVCSWRIISAQNAHVSSLCRCDERTRVNKSLFQALKSSPVVFLVSHRQRSSDN